LTFVVVLAEKKNVVWHCWKTRLFELAFRPFADCFSFIEALWHISTSDLV